MKNKPYVKELDELRNVLNPIKRSYLHSFPNRQERRQKDKRFKGNNKGNSINVIGKGKYFRINQFIKCKDKKGNLTGEVRRIEHYIYKGLPEDDKVNLHN